MESTSPVPRVCRECIHMEAMGLWCSILMSRIRNLLVLTRLLPAILPAKRDCPAGSRFLFSQMWNYIRFDWIYSLYIYCRRWLYLQFCFPDFLGSLYAFACVCFIRYIQTFDSGHVRLTLGLFGRLPVSFSFHVLTVILCCIAVVLGGWVSGRWWGGGSRSPV